MASTFPCSGCNSLSIIHLFKSFCDLSFTKFIKNVKIEHFCFKIVWKNQVYSKEFFLQIAHIQIFENWHTTDQTSPLTRLTEWPTGIFEFVRRRIAHLQHRKTWELLKRRTSGSLWPICTNWLTFLWSKICNIKALILLHFLPALFFDKWRHNLLINFDILLPEALLLSKLIMGHYTGDVI